MLFLYECLHERLALRYATEGTKENVRTIQARHNATLKDLVTAFKPDSKNTDGLRKSMKV